MATLKGWHVHKPAVNYIGPIVLNNWCVPYVTTYATLSYFYDDGHSGWLMIVLFLTVADWPSRHCKNLKVSRRSLRTIWKKCTRVKAEFVDIP